MGGFFALAEQAGVIRDLDWLCRRAAVAGIPTLPGKVFLSINVSTELLMDNPAAFFIAEHYRGYPAICVRLSAVRRPELEFILKRSWEMEFGPPNRR